MSGAVRPAGGASIFRHSLALALGSAFALALASMTLVLLAPAPFYFPISTFEVARLVRGEPIARTDERFARMIAATPAVSTQSQDPTTLALRDAVAKHLGARRDDVRLILLPGAQGGLEPALNAARKRYNQVLINDAAIYGAHPEYAPLVFGAFQVSVRQADGQWVSIVRKSGGDAFGWQIGLLGLIGLALILILPVVWQFSRRLALPIRDFAAAADRVGRGGIEQVAVNGPREIQIAATAINEMQARLDAYVKQRTAVVGAIAHDLRTPLARLAFLLAAAPEPLRGKIQRELDGMERMVAVTLDFVRSEAAPLRREPIDLRLLVEGVVDDFADRGAPVALEANKTHMPLVISGDSILLKRLITNLISNAINYGGAAQVSVSREDQGALMEVRDTGPGMNEADLARAFDPFFRGEKSRNDQTGGIGLGLAIVQSIARAHQGDVRLENRPDGGLRVQVRLP
jgi:two-component system, OmpR family, sensor kinase